MPRAFSPEAVSQINASTNDDPFIWLITLYAGKDVFRVCRNNEKIVSRGLTFEPYPFEIIEPIEDGETMPRAQLTIDNVDRLLIQSIRTLQDPLRVDIELVMVSEPDVPQIRYQALRLKAVTWDELSIRGDLVYEDLFGLAYPAESFYPQEYPGLF